MKKIIVSLLILVAVYIGFALMKPVESMEKAVQVNCTETALTRNLMNIKLWKNWWPGKQENDTTFSFNSVTYIVKNLLANGVLLQIKSLDNSEYFYFQSAALTDTSSIIKFNSAQKKSLGIIDRILLPLSKDEQGKNITSLLDSLKVYFDDPVNIYGFKAISTKVTDPHLISIKKQYLNYPTTADIYSNIKSLQDFALLNGAKQTNAPMLNVHISESGFGVDAMIAIPIDKALEAKGNFQPKFMIEGALLQAEITGGAAKVQKAISEFENYLRDYKLSAPAIPYQSLVTDRMATIDSNKWITNIYQPIFRK